MDIRNIISSDYSEFISMCKDFYNSPAASHAVSHDNFKKTFEKALINNNIICKIILENEKIAGYSLLFHYYSNEAGCEGIMLDELYIKPEYRSLGLGTKFIEIIKNIEKVEFIRLEVNPENPRAKKLYEQLGFKPLPYISMIN